MTDKLQWLRQRAGTVTATATFFIPIPCKTTQQHTAVPHLLQRPFIGAHALDEGDGEGVQLVGLVSLVDDGQRYAEAEVLQVAHLK